VIVRVLVAVLAAAGTLAAAYALRRLKVRRRVRARLAPGESPRPSPLPRPAGSRVRLGVFVLAVAVGAGTGAFTFAVTDWGVAIAAAVGLLLGVLISMIGSLAAVLRTSRLQLQLANTIDLMVSSLHAGAGLMDGLLAAEREAPAALRRRLEALTTRVRVGERPSRVCRELARRSELESFRLFFAALAVQWESGASLAPVLSDVGRFVRDQLEIHRRVRAQTAEVRLSVLGILGLTGLVALLMWQAYPERIAGFFSSELGRGAVAASVALQAVGVLWIYRTSRIRY